MMMMETRIIHTKFWKDDYISKLSHKEKLLFIYLLTNETINICGIYELPDKYICIDLELTQTELDSYKEKFKKDNKFDFSNGWVKIINVDKYNSFNGPKNEIARQNQLLRVPKELYTIDTSINTSIDTTHNHNTNHYPNLNPNKEKTYKLEGNTMVEVD